MQQLHDLPVEQRAMHFGHYMRQTQLHLQQHHMQQQQQVSLLPVSPPLLPDMSKLHDECISKFAGEVQQPNTTASARKASWMSIGINCMFAYLPSFRCHQGYESQYVAAAKALPRHTQAVGLCASLL